MYRNDTGAGRPRVLLIAAAAAVALVGTLAATPALAMESDTNLTQTSSGRVLVSCETPNAVGAEASPTVSSQGVTVGPTTTPELDVPPVTVNQVTVGPVTAGPLTIGGYTVPSQTFGGTYGAADQADQVAAVGATNCTGVNIDDHTQMVALGGTLRLLVLLDEVNPTTNAVGFVQWSEVDAPLTTTALFCACRPPNPIPLPLASGTTTIVESAVPGAGQLDVRTGNTSLGLAQIYVGVPLSVNGVQQSAGVGCAATDFSCSTSAVFPVY